MRLHQLIAALAALSLLAGCGAVWGKPHNVTFSNSSSITMSYDPMLTSTGNLQSVTQEHCDRSGRDAIPQAAVSEGWGLESMTFQCFQRSESVE